MSSLSVLASGIAGHRAMAAIEARRMARYPIFLVGVALGFVVLGLHLALNQDDVLTDVLTLPVMGAFYIGLPSLIAAARPTRSTDGAVEVRLSRSG